MRDARAANLLSSVRGLSHRKIGVIARLDRAIQYAAAFPISLLSLEYWIPRLPPTLQLRRANTANPGEALV
jgi:hypothetical protein